jgi:hypothetical protein
MKTLRIGSIGIDVNKLQNLLFKRGFELLVDSIFGRETEAKVKQFQTINDLKDDGVVGEKTWTALRADNYPLSAGDNHEALPQKADSASNKHAVCVFSLKNDAETQITPNFKVREFASKCGDDMIFIDTDFVKNKLQKIREHFNKPIKITSGYRSEAHNKKTGGSKNSYHLKGEAFDISVSDITPSEVCKYAESIGILGVIQYPNWTHIDSRTVKYFSKDSAKTATNTFG